MTLADIRDRVQGFSIGLAAVLSIMVLAGTLVVGAITEVQKAECTTGLLRPLDTDCPDNW